MPVSLQSIFLTLTDLPATLLPGKILQAKSQ